LPSCFGDTTFTAPIAAELVEPNTGGTEGQTAGVVVTRERFMSFNKWLRSSKLAEWPEGVRLDAVYAWRGLRRSPAFTLAVVLVLALGLGANAAVFSVVDRLFSVPTSTEYRRSTFWCRPSTSAAWCSPRDGSDIRVDGSGRIRAGGRRRSHDGPTRLAT
jgi:hypothetical protein